MFCGYSMEYLVEAITMNNKVCFVQKQNATYPKLSPHKSFFTLSGAYQKQNILLFLNIFWFPFFFFLFHFYDQQKSINISKKKKKKKKKKRWIILQQQMFFFFFFFETSSFGSNGLQDCILAAYTRSTS